MEFGPSVYYWHVIPYSWVVAIALLPILVRVVGSLLSGARRPAAAALLPISLAGVWQAVGVSYILVGSEATGTIVSLEQILSLSEELALCTDLGLVLTALYSMPTILRSLRRRQLGLPLRALGPTALLLCAASLLVQVLVLAFVLQVIAVSASWRALPMLLEAVGVGVAIGIGTEALRRQRLPPEA